MLLYQQRQLAGCDQDSNVLSAAELELLLTFVLQVLNPMSDIMGDEGLRTAAETFKEKVAEVLAGRRATACEVLPKLDATQVMSEHILHFFCRLYKNYGL